jgi:tol-pal system protein YbgF
MKKILSIIIGLMLITGVEAFAEAPVIEAGEQPLAHDDINITVSNNNLNEIKALQQDIQELRSELERQAHEIQILKGNKLESQADITYNQKSNVISSHNSESSVYLAAYDFITQNQDAKAMQAFGDFLTQYPSGGYAPNAHYWLGELNMRQQNYEKALAEFKWVLDNTPKASKVPDCMLKQGYTYAAMGQYDKAHAILKKVMQQYPDTSVAHLAGKKLQSL